MNERIFGSPEQAGNRNKTEAVAMSPELKERVVAFYQEHMQEKFQEHPERAAFFAQRVENQIQGESQFYSRVLSAAEQAKKEHPDKEILSLFDVDETLMVAKRSDDGFEHIMRPSAIELFSNLRGKEISIGLFTTRGNLDEQMNTELKDVAPFLDPRFLISTREVDVFPEELAGLEARIPEAKRNLAATGDLSKIKALDAFIAEHPELVVVPVDDLMYPEVYQYGVALGDNEKFFV